MAKVHFVYTKGSRLKTPDTILAEIGQRLRARYDVAFYDMAETVTITPSPGDILIGHPSRFVDDSVFNRSFRQPGWARRIVFCPFSHAMPLDAAAIDPLVEEADIMLALCGPHWFDTAGQSLFSHWTYKMMRCDLGVDRERYPLSKQSFNRPGERRFLYIGNAGPMKGGDYYCALAEANPTLEFGWIGEPGMRLRPPGTLRRDYRAIDKRLRAGRIRVHGGADWRKTDHISTVCSYDFLLTCGRSDSNPTTILESAAWGLIPVAPRQCGYIGGNWLVEIPLDDLAGASRILHALNDAPEAELLARRRACLDRLDRDYTWDRAADQVVAAIEAPPPVRPRDTAWQARKQDNQRRLRAIVRRYRWEQTIEDAIVNAAWRWPRAAGRRIKQLARG